MNKEQKKAKAIELMKKLNIHKPYIDGFEQKDLVCFFERFAGYWDYQEPEIEAKRKELEARFKCTGYAITHDFTAFGELYTFLLVTNYKSEWSRLLMRNGKDFYAFAYVWNKDDDCCSELGTVVIQSGFGGIRRIG